MRQPVLTVIALCVAATAADAAIFGRAPLTPGGTDYQAYYDTAADLTWLADASFAKTSGYDADGAMTWQQSLNWIASLNSQNHLGTNTWRLPAAAPINGVAYDVVQRYDGSGDRSYNISAPGTTYGGSLRNEMAFLYHVSLNKVSYYDTAGGVRPGWGTSYNGPFTNVGRSYYYWSGSLVSAGQPIAFSFDHGGQDFGNLIAPSYAWPVASGDPLYSGDQPALPAGLRGRSPAQAGKTDYQAWYDIGQDITWTSDANLAATSSFGVTGIGTSASAGRMTWDTAQAWIAAMNAAHYLGANDWRLASVTDTETPGCEDYYSGSDCGYNVDLATGELAHLYYATLGNIAAYDAEGVTQPCRSAHYTYCLTNTAPFRDFRSYDYWSGTEYAPDALQSWAFESRTGRQHNASKTETYYTWAVRDGDIDPTPDLDGDGVADDADNCAEVANPGQFDGDADGYGNRCDGDLDNDGTVNAQDTVLFRSQLGTSDPAADLNHNGTVNAQDTVLFRQLLGSPPGPSGRVQ